MKTFENIQRAVLMTAIVVNGALLLPSVVNLLIAVLSGQVALFV